MAIPGIPKNLQIQQANGDVLVTWDFVSGADTYIIERGLLPTSLAILDSTIVNNLYQDGTATVGSLYYYRVAAHNSDGTSPYSVIVSITPTDTADLSLGQLRLMSQQRADRVNSPFVTMAEWNTYIRQSYFELYDLLVTVYEDYFLTTPYEFQTDGSTSQYTLPTDLYKLMGVDCGVAGSSQAFVSLRKFDFISRNRYLYPNQTSTILGLTNLQYRMLGSTLMLIPCPSAGQTIRLWYIPKRSEPLQDIDILRGVSGWTEYIIVDAAIKALQKEESDVSVLMAQKMALKMRIEESAMNRDAGQPDTISATRVATDTFGYGFNGDYWGY